MSDAAFVIAAYAIVIGGLVSYTASIARRAIVARRVTAEIERHRALDAVASADGPASEDVPPPYETLP